MTVEATDSLLVDETHKDGRLLFELIIQLIAGATEAPVRGCDGVLTDRDAALTLSGRTHWSPRFACSLRHWDVHRKDSLASAALVRVNRSSPRSLVRERGTRTANALISRSS